MTSKTPSLSQYHRLTRGGRVSLELTQDEAAVALKAYDNGVGALNEDDRSELDSLIAKLKEQIWP